MEKKLKILTVCEHGNVRSVALAYLLKTIYGHDVLACGIRENSEETRLMLFEWADMIVFLDNDVFKELEKKFASTFIKSNIKILDIGKDVWHDAFNQELQHRLLRRLKLLDL